VRHGVRNILETQDDWEVVGEASNGEEAIELNQELKPDAIVMDITMPVMNGLHATRNIMKSNPNCRVLILTVLEDPSLSRPIQLTGARGLVSKTNAMDELTPALKAILAGNTYFPHEN